MLLQHIAGVRAGYVSTIAITRGTVTGQVKRQPGSTTKGVGVGADLGLSICHQIVNDHRGQINVESEEGKGSTFTTILSCNFKGIGLGY